MGRPFRDLRVFAVALLLLAGCATTENASPQEGRVILRAGTSATGGEMPKMSPGPEIRRLAVLAPAFDPFWHAVWLNPDRKGSPGGGAYAGLLTGVLIVQSVPVLIGFWPAAVGVVAGTTALGALGAQLDPAAHAKIASDDRSALVQAALDLAPDRLLRQSAAEALARRLGQAPLSIPWYPTWGPDTPGTDALADALGKGADGILDITLEAFGLAMGEEADTFGVFLRVRACLVEPASGGLRYERILEHGPGRPLTGLPRPTTYTLDFLALDQGRVLRHEMQETIRRMARILAEDPALPVRRR